MTDLSFFIPISGQINYYFSDKVPARTGPNHEQL